MSQAGPGILFDHVSKRYVWRRDRTRSFLDVFTGLFRRRSPAEEFWALRDLSLSVAPGEAVGLIGPNGAGKSTALKLASRVVDPTSGQVQVSGRVSALLELAAGFHPDLTGRENVFLSGALMGLSRREVLDRYEGIVDFAGVGDFIDSPVRHYSSGMAMRLGFAVAGSVDPDVLLIDEVLAVGDRAFSQRCLDRIYSLRERGTAILFVSHDLEAVRSLCDRALLLEQGEVTHDGPTDRVIAQYLQRVAEGDRGHSCQEREERWGSGEIKIGEVWLEDEAGGKVSGVPVGRPFVVAADYTSHSAVSEPVIGLALRDETGHLLSGPNTRFDGVDLASLPSSGEVRYQVNDSRLLPGRYFLSISVYDSRLMHAYDHWEFCLGFDIFPDESSRCFGIFSLAGDWALSEVAPGREMGGDG